MRNKCIPVRMSTVCCVERRRHRRKYTHGAQDATALARRDPTDHPPAAQHLHRRVHGVVHHGTGPSAAPDAVGGIAPRTRHRGGELSRRGAREHLIDVSAVAHPLLPRVLHLRSGGASGRNVNGLQPVHAQLLRWDVPELHVERALRTNAGGHAPVARSVMPSSGHPDAMAHRTT